jgi:hypothetical protein
MINEELEVPTHDKPHFNSLIEAIVWNIADMECQWQGDTQFSCGIFSEVFLDAKALAIIEFMIPHALGLPHYWIVQKTPVIQCTPYDTLAGLKDWWDVLYDEQTHWTMELFDEPSYL